MGGGEVPHLWVGRSENRSHLEPIFLFLFFSVSVSVCLPVSVCLAFSVCLSLIMGGWVGGVVLTLACQTRHQLGVSLLNQNHLSGVLCRGWIQGETEMQKMEGIQGCRARGVSNQLRLLTP